MFDDLHDPAPPTAGLDTLARVSARAKAIRRRRVALVSGASVIAAALVAAAVVLPGRDRSTIAPADTVDTSVPESNDAVANGCERLTDPVWLPNGEVAGTSEPQSGIDPFGGDRIEGRIWLSPEGYGLLVQLPGGSDVFDLPPSGQTWDLRVRDARPNADSVEVTIWRGADRCVARYLVPGEVEAATAWGATFVDMLTAATSEGPISTDAEGCVLVLGRRLSCVFPGTIDLDATTGSIAASYELIGSDEDDASIRLRQGFGVVQHVIGAGDEISPRSRLSFEVPIEGTSLKRIVDLVPPLDRWCGTIRRASGEVGYIEVDVPVETAAGGTAEAAADAGCRPPTETSTPNTASTTASTTLVPAPTTDDVPPSSTGADTVVAITATEVGVAFFDGVVPTEVHQQIPADEPGAPAQPTGPIDGIALSPDGSIAIIGVCCDPPDGLLWRSGLVGGSFPRSGHLPAATAGGNLVWATSEGVVIGGLDGSVATTLLELDPSEWTVTDLAVVQRGSEPEEVLVLASRADGTYLWRVAAGGGDMQFSQKISDAVGADAQLSLAGWRGDAFYVLDGANDRMLAFRAQDLQPTGSDVRSFDGEVIRWRSAWLTPTLPRHVEENGELWVLDSSWGGDYRWVR